MCVCAYIAVDVSSSQIYIKKKIILRFDTCIKLFKLNTTAGRRRNKKKS